MGEVKQPFNKKGSFIKSNIQIKTSSIHRYGVFATKDFHPEDIVEECPVIIFPRVEEGYYDEINNRVFDWDDKHNAFALGYGSIYNHSDNFNARYCVDYDNGIIEFIADKPISIGEEVLVDYGGKYWFMEREMKIVKSDDHERENTNGLYKVFGLIIILFILAKIFPIQELSNNISLDFLSKPDPVSVI